MGMGMGAIFAHEQCIMVLTGSAEPHGQSNLPAEMAMRSREREEEKARSFKTQFHLQKIHSRRR
jgi:hypothetical protein